VPKSKEKKATYSKPLLPTAGQTKEKVDVSAWGKLGISEAVLEALSEKGFSTPTKIQTLAIPPAIKNQSDILGAAETGSGKTLAFAIPIVDGVANIKRKWRQKQLQSQMVDINRKATQEKKKRRDEKAIKFEDSEEEEDDSKYESASEDDVEEYLFNGPEGMITLTHDEYLKQNKKKRKKKKKGKASIDVDNIDENDLDAEYDVESDDDGFSETLKDSYDDSENEGEDYDGDSAQDSEEVDSEAEDLDGEDLLEEGADMGSDDEENYSGSSSEGDDDDQQEHRKIGLVRVINNVQFPFVKRKKPDGKLKLLALIITPTRELAVQIHAHITAITKYCDVSSCVLVGGMDVHKQKRILARQRPEIVVATPGKLWDLMQDDVDHLSDLTSVRYFAVDEADRLADEKSFEEVGKIIRLMNGGDEVNHQAKNNRQTFIFSATLTMMHKLPTRLQTDTKNVKQWRQNTDKLTKLTKIIGAKKTAKVFDLSRQHGTAEKLAEARISCDTYDKDYYLYYFLLSHPGRTMVFCNSIEAIRRLVSLFSLLAFEAHELHAKMHQTQRLRSLERFSSNEKGLLITSDVAARGLDIPNVQHVLHYQVPFTAETYVHRSGRTARGHNAGLSLCLVEPKLAQKFRAISVTLNRTRGSDIPDFPVDENVYQQVIERVDMARELEKTIYKANVNSNSDAQGRISANHAGVTQEEETMDQEDFYLMDPEARKDFIMRKGQSKAFRSEVRRRKAELEHLLGQPIIGSVFSKRNPMSRSALAAALEKETNQIPEGLVGVNMRTDILKEIEDGFMSTKMIDSNAMLKKYRKDLGKLKTQMLNPEAFAKNEAKKRRDKNVRILKIKSQKKKDKRRKKKGLAPLNSKDD